MAKAKLTFAQLSTPMGGVNHIPLTYRISAIPIGDVIMYGELAHVSHAIRKRIMESGFGEMSAHIEHIRKRIGVIKKLKMKPLSEHQQAMEF